MGAIAVQGAIGGPGEKATTSLPDYNFNSMAVINGFPFGASDNGIYKLNSGNLDDGAAFTKFITLATTDFGDEHPKHVRYFYISIETDYDFKVLFKADVQEERTLNASRLKDGLHWVRVENIYPDVGKYWTISISSQYHFRADKIRVVYYSISRGNLTYEKVI